MKNLFIFFLIFIGLTSFKASSSNEEPSDNQVKWLTIEEAEQLNAVSPKKIMVFFYTDWCGYCKQMERTTFKDPSVVNQLNNDYYAVRFNAEQKEPVTFDGIEYDYKDSEMGNGINGLAYDMLMGQKVMPTLIFLDEDKTSIKRLVGVQPTDLFSVFLKYISDDAYLNQDWYQYSNQE